MHFPRRHYKSGHGLSHPLWRCSCKFWARHPEPGEDSSRAAFMSYKLPHSGGGSVGGAGVLTVLRTARDLIPWPIMSAGPVLWEILTPPENSNVTCSTSEQPLSPALTRRIHFPRQVRQPHLPQLVRYSARERSKAMIIGSGRFPTPARFALLPAGVAAPRIVGVLVPDISRAHLMSLR